MTSKGRRPGQDTVNLRVFAEVDNRSGMDVTNLVKVSKVYVMNIGLSDREKKGKKRTGEFIFIFDKTIASGIETHGISFNIFLRTTTPGKRVTENTDKIQPGEQPHQ